jgi:hypothetical protein
MDYGRVRIYPQPSGVVLPQLQYHFYRADNPAGRALVYPGDDRGYFEGSLSAGTYRVIATNTGAANVTFDMESCDEATVTTLVDGAARGTRAESVYLAQPDSVYSVVVRELVVGASGSPLQRPAPVLLTRRIDLSFGLEGEGANDIIALAGVLQGIYPSARLYSQTAWADDGFDAALSVMTFDGVEVFSDGKRGFKASLSLFGLCDPKDGEVYDNNLALTIDLNNDRGKRSEEIKVPLTEKLSDWFAEHGDNPLDEIVIKVPLSLGETSITVGSVIVESWEEVENEVEKEVVG